MRHTDRRVKAMRHTTYCHSTDEYTETQIQYLQEKKRIKILGATLFSFWSTIDTEIVPMYAMIQIWTLGFTDWKSKWHNMEGILWAKIK